MLDEKSRAKPSSASAEPVPEEKKSYVCKRCEVEITDSRALFCMRSNSVEQVFPNPLGMMRVILTARAAKSLHLSGDATVEFTWFAGYAWRVAYCASCMSHLGWSYEGEEEPPVFYGLLKDALAER